MQTNILELIQIEQQKKELQQLLDWNTKTKKFGLTLTEEDAQELMIYKQEVLKTYQRIELEQSILTRLIEEFCDSPYIQQDEYVNVLEELQEIFYLYKNESEDKLSDDELIKFMKEQFESVCYGSTEYLGGTCLERFSRAIRAGYSGYKKGEFETFSEEMRWDRDLYLLALEELID